MFYTGTHKIVLISRSLSPSKDFVVYSLAFQRIPPLLSSKGVINQPTFNQSAD